MFAPNGRAAGILGLTALGGAIWLAGAAAAEPLTLDEAVRMAVARAPAVHAEEEGVKGAEARENRVLSLRLPRVDFEESYMRANQPVASFGNRLNQGGFTPNLLDPVTDPNLTALNDPKSLDNFRTKFTVTQPLFAGGELMFRQKMLAGETEAASWDLEGIRSRTGFRAIEAYWGFSLAGESETVARESVANAEESLRQTEVLYKEGTVVRSDLLLSQVQLADFRDQYVQASGQTRVARRALEILVGPPATGFWEVAELCVPGTEEIPDLEPAGLLAGAQQARPEYVALLARWRAAGQGVKAAKGSFLPHLGLEASYEWNAPKFATGQNGSYILGVGVNWNLFRGFGDLAGVAEAASRQRMLAYELRRMADQIALEIEEAVEGVRTGSERLAVTRERVGMAEESLRIIQKRYREGLTTIVELQAAELALSRSRLAWFRAIHDLRIAMARLRLTTGDLLASVDAETCAPRNAAP